MYILGLQKHSGTEVLLLFRISGVFFSCVYIRRFGLACAVSWSLHCSFLSEGGRVGSALRWQGTQCAKRTVLSALQEARHSVRVARCSQCLALARHFPCSSLFALCFLVHIVFCSLLSEGGRVGVPCVGKALSAQSALLFVS